METGGGNGLGIRQAGQGVQAPSRRATGLCGRSRGLEGPHSLGTGLEAALARLLPRDHILQLRTVFILEVGSKQYLL